MKFFLVFKIFLKKKVPMNTKLFVLVLFISLAFGGSSKQAKSSSSSSAANDVYNVFSFFPKTFFLVLSFGFFPPLILSTWCTQLLLSDVSKTNETLTEAYALAKEGEHYIKTYLKEMYNTISGVYSGDYKDSKSFYSKLNEVVTPKLKELIYSQKNAKAKSQEASEKIEKLFDAVVEDIKVFFTSHFKFFFFHLFLFLLPFPFSNFPPFLPFSLLSFPLSFLFLRSPSFLCFYLLLFIIYFFSRPFIRQQQSLTVLPI